MRLFPQPFQRLFELFLSLLPEAVSSNPTLVTLSSIPILATLVCIMITACRSMLHGEFRVKHEMFSLSMICNPRNDRVKFRPRLIPGKEEQGRTQRSFCHHPLAPLTQAAVNSWTGDSNICCDVRIPERLSSGSH